MLLVVALGGIRPTPVGDTTGRISEAGALARGASPVTISSTAA